MSPNNAAISNPWLLLMINSVTLCIRGDNVWQIIIANLIGNNSLKLRVTRNGSGPYDRDLLYILVSDYLTQMMAG